MNRREIKRKAWYHVAAIVQNAVEAGWEYESYFDNEADVLRFEEMLTEIQREMERRAGLRPATKALPEVGA